MIDSRLPAFAVLLAGGSGTRLWPVSRELHPKQLARLLGPDSLIQSTLRRLVPPFPAASVRVVCRADQEPEIARHLEAVGVPAADRIYSEPVGRNTAAAVLRACLEIRREAPDAVLGVFPADHVIARCDAFHEALAQALRLAAEGRIVAFGIRPRYPETGYGYIEAEASRGEAAPIRRFVEKPDLATARRYVEAGTYFWNSGMFAFRAAVVVEEFAAHAPELLAGLEPLCGRPGPIAAEEYARLPDVSFDVAVMEKTSRGVVLPVDLGWSDIGSWKSLYDFLPKDGRGNVLEGDVIAREARGCLVLGRSRLIAVNRIADLVVVETPDSLFISDLESSRDVKEIVAELKRRGRPEAERHLTVAHPWGTLTRLDSQASGATCRLSLDPGARARLGEPGNEALHLVVLNGEVRIRGRRGRPRRLLAGEGLRLAAPSGVEVENPTGSAVDVVAVFWNAEAPPAGRGPA